MNVIHTGDLFFPEAYPDIDIGNGGSVNRMIAAADRIVGMSNEKTKIIPGHGRLSDRRRLQEYRTMLVTVRGLVGTMTKEGRKLEAVVASEPTADFDTDWTAGVGLRADTFVARVYNDLSR